MPVHRRRLLVITAALSAACSAGTQQAGMAGSPVRVSQSLGAPAPYIVVAPSEPREQTADQQVQQVLNRLGFGPRPGDVAKVREMGVDKWIALQLAPDRVDDGAADRIVASYELLAKPTSEFVAMYTESQVALRKNGKLQAAQGDTSSKKDMRAEMLRDDPALRDMVRQNQRVLGDVQSAKLARAVVSERQLQEVMTDFWENHFTVFAGKGQVRFFIPAYDRDVIRPRAMGKFRDLLGAVAKSPAMLFYLDQWQSAADSLHPTLASMRAGRLGGAAAARRAAAAGAAAQQRLQQAQGRRRGLNENYARELMELHTLGVDGGYTQSDIIEVARALTGWTMNPRGTAEFVFDPRVHDAAEKKVLGHVLPAGRGIEDGEDVLDIVARDPHTARFIARKLAIRLVSDAPPAALVDRAAATFTRTDGDIRETVRTIVTSPEFFSRSAYRVKVKSPFELVASALRAVGAQADTSMRSAQLVGFLGAPIFGHQAPNGWPETGEAWMNSGAILNRINFGLGLAAGRYPGARIAQWSEAERLRTAPREQQVDGVVLAFFGGQSSPDTRQILLSGENPLAAKLATTVKPDSASTEMTSMTMGAPRRDREMPPGKDGAPRAAAGRGIGAGPQVQLNGLAQVVGLAIGAPEFQRR
ncbi:MAG: DUF1800 domain-containing protein [Gemmatimonadota bacterium]